MAVLLPVERKTKKARFFLFLVYSILSLGGLTMIWPFLVMIAASFSGPYDYYRFSPAVRAVWDRNDRFLRYVSTCFPRFPSSVFPDAPAHWSSWIIVARDHQNRDAFAERHLQPLSNPQKAADWKAASADYATFNKTYEVRNSLCAFDPRDVASFVQNHYENQCAKNNPSFRDLPAATRRDQALQRLHEEWKIHYPSFFSIRMLAQQRLPLHHASWDYEPDDTKTDLYQSFKKSYRDHAEGPMSRTIPFESRPLWHSYLSRQDVRQSLGVPAASPLTPKTLSHVLGISFPTWEELPFPLPAHASAKAKNCWDHFIHHVYPRRLLRIRPSAALNNAYQQMIRERCRTPEAYTRLTGKPIRSFSEITLPAYENTTLWRDFIPHVPLSSLTILSAEQAWQDFLKKKYKTLHAVNEKYGWSVSQWESLRFPFREALAVTFDQYGWKLFFKEIFANYRTVSEFLFLRGRAFGNTLWLVILSVLASLTINPLAAYALSRFHLRGTEKILLFLLATMAFPAAVTAIPGFLLIRDLGLLNTFAALILPTVASGMSIFILKGFFDALPRELYEAAAIDGAPEFQIFLRITLPMTTPILAVNALNAFIHAYNSWEWALLVCQKQSHWTLAVWMYQMSQQWSGQPWAVMAGFVLVSIPTAIVFIVCQKVILRGIVLPSMK